MRELKIVHLYDYYDCDQCGGGSAEGARIELDGKVVAELIPVAHCFSGINFSERDIMNAVIKSLGIEDIIVVEEYL